MLFKPRITVNRWHNETEHTPQNEARGKRRPMAYKN